MAVFKKENIAAPPLKDRIDGDLPTRPDGRRGPRVKIDGNSIVFPGDTIRPLRHSRSRQTAASYLVRGVLEYLDQRGECPRTPVEFEQACRKYPDVLLHDHRDEARLRDVPRWLAEQLGRQGMVDTHIRRCIEKHQKRASDFEAGHSHDVNLLQSSDCSLPRVGVTASATPDKREIFDCVPNHDPLLSGTPAEVADIIRGIFIYLEQKGIKPKNGERFQLACLDSDACFFTSDGVLHELKAVRRDFYAQAGGLKKFDDLVRAHIKDSRTKLFPCRLHPQVDGDDPEYFPESADLIIKATLEYLRQEGKVPKTAEEFERWCFEDTGGVLDDKGSQVHVRLVPDVVSDWLGSAYGRSRIQEIIEERKKEPPRECDQDVKMHAVLCRAGSLRCITTRNASYLTGVILSYLGGMRQRPITAEEFEKACLENSKGILDDGHMQLPVSAFPAKLAQNFGGPEKAREHLQAIITKYNIEARLDEGIILCPRVVLDRETDARTERRQARSVIDKVLLYLAREGRYPRSAEEFEKACIDDAETVLAGSDVRIPLSGVPARLSTWLGSRDELLVCVQEIINKQRIGTKSVIPVPAKETARVEALDSLVSLDPIPPAVFLRERNINNISELSKTERQALMKEYKRENLERIEPLRSAIYELAQVYHIDPLTLRTSSFEGIAIESANGEWKFRSFGLMMSALSRFGQELHGCMTAFPCSWDLRREARRAITPITELFNPVGPEWNKRDSSATIPVMHETPDNRSIYGEITRTAHYHLKSLSHPTEGLSPRKRAELLTKQVRELCLQVCGGIPVDTDLGPVRGFIVCDEAGRTFVDTNMLVINMLRAREEAGLSARPKNLLAALEKAEESGKRKKSRAAQFTAVPPREVAKLSALDQLESLTVIGAERFIPANLSQIPMDERSGIVEQLRDQNYALSELLDAAVYELAQQYGVDPNSLRTSSFEGVAVESTDGRVKFGSFGELLSLRARFEQTLAEESNKLSSALGLPKDPARVVTPVGALSMVVDLEWDKHGCSVELPVPTVSTAVGHGFSIDTPADYQLKSLSRSTTGLSPDEKASLLTNQVRELCIQAYGSIPKSLKMLEDFLLCDERGEYFIESNTLLAEMRRAREAAGLPVGPKKLHAALVSQEEQKIERRQQRYSRLVHEQKIPGDLLFLTLSSLGHFKPTVKSRRKFDHFLKKAVKEPKPGAAGHTPARPMQDFTDVLRDSKKTVQAQDLDSLGKSMLSALLRQLCYRAFRGDPERMLEEIEACKAQELPKGDPSSAWLRRVLDEICPPLIKSLELTRKFETPSNLDFKLLEPQKEAVAGALYGGRSIIIFGPGTGKTETAAAFLEASEGEGGLWCTRTGNREDTADRLREMLKNGKKVHVLGPEEMRFTPEQLTELLSDNPYIVAGYDTLRDMMRRNPEGFEVLRAWLSTRSKVLDEAQMIDNGQSGRAQAIEMLQSDRTLVITANIYQHKLRNAATLVHFALPELYPNIEDLRARFAADPEYARAVIHQHATIFSMNDIAEEFESPDIIPFEVQLASEIPRVPKTEVHLVPCMLSDELSRVYVDIATNYPVWARLHGVPPDPLGQVRRVKQVLVHPEKLGAGPPLAMIEGVKQLVLPMLERGEKVFIMGHHTHLLKLLAEDPEIAPFGARLLTQDVPTKERCERLRELEENPHELLEIGGFQAIGTGHNCRSMDHIVMLETPQTMSGLNQAMGRAVRIITRRDIRFAREKVHFWCMYPELQPDVINEITDPECRKYLENGTKHKDWMLQMLAAVDDYNMFLRMGKDIPSSENGISILLKGLQEARAALIREGEARPLLSTRYSYNNPLKNGWRTEGVENFVSANLPWLDVAPEDLMAVTLAGPETLEAHVYRRNGMQPHNIAVIEGGSREVQSECRSNCIKHGYTFYGGRMEDVLPGLARKGHRFDVVSIDLNGPMQPRYSDLIRRLPIAERAIILKNSLMCREQADAQALIEAAGGQRHYLDAILVKMAGTAAMYAEGVSPGVDAVRITSTVRSISRSLAGAISRNSGLREDRLAEFLTELYLGSPHTNAFRQFSYSSTNGSRFLSTFAAVEKWDDGMRNAPAALALRQVISDCLHEKARLPLFNIEESGGTLRITNRENVYIVPVSELGTLLGYFEAHVPEKYSLKRLLATPPEHVEFKGGSYEQSDASGLLVPAAST